MELNGTLVNYYFHCRRQCYLFGNRLNLEDNSEMVQIGRAIHEEKSAGSENSEIAIDHIRLDKLTRDYLVEIKKSDADVEASRWQLIYYLKVLKEKGVERKGKLEFVEKTRGDKKVMIVELTPEILLELETHLDAIRRLIEGKDVPEVQKKPGCRKCAYYEYCLI